MNRSVANWVRERNVCTDKEKRIRNLLLINSGLTEPSTLDTEELLVNTLRKLNEDRVKFMAGGKKTTSINVDYLNYLPNDTTTLFNEPGEVKPELAKLLRSRPNIDTPSSVSSYIIQIARALAQYDRRAEPVLTEATIIASAYTSRNTTPASVPYNTFQEDLITSRENLSKCREELMRCNDDKRNLDDKVQNASLEIVQLKEMVIGYERNIADLNARVADSDQIDKLTGDYETLQQQNVELSRENNSFTERYNDLVEQIERLVDENSMLKGKLEAEMDYTVLKEIENCERNMESQLEDINNELRLMRDRHEACLAEKDRLTVDYEECLAVSENNRRQIGEHLETIEMLNKHLQDTHTDYDTRLSETQASLDDLRIQNERYAKDIQLANDSVIDLKDTKVRLLQQRNDNLDQISRLELDVAAKGAEIERLTEVIEANVSATEQQRTQQFLAESRSTDATIEALKEQIIKLNTQLRDYEEETDNIVQEVNETCRLKIEQRVSEVTAEMNAMEEQLRLIIDRLTKENEQRCQTIDESSALFNPLKKLLIACVDMVCDRPTYTLNISRLEAITENDISGATSLYFECVDDLFDYFLQVNHSMIITLQNIANPQTAETLRRLWIDDYSTLRQAQLRDEHLKLTKAALKNIGLGEEANDEEIWRPQSETYKPVVNVNPTQTQPQVAAPRKRVALLRSEPLKKTSATKSNYLDMNLLLYEDLDVSDSELDESQLANKRRRQKEFNRLPEENKEFILKLKARKKNPLLDPSRGAYYRYVNITDLDTLAKWQDEGRYDLIRQHPEYGKLLELERLVEGKNLTADELKLLEEAQKTAPIQLETEPETTTTKGFVVETGVAPRVKSIMDETYKISEAIIAAQEAKEKLTKRKASEAVGTEKLPKLSVESGTKEERERKMMRDESEESIVQTS